MRREFALSTKAGADPNAEIVLDSGASSPCAGHSGSDRARAPQGRADQHRGGNC
jgi:hypothetical protein